MRPAEFGRQSNVSLKVLARLLLVAAALSGCATTRPPSSFEGGAPLMRPEAFFSGATTSSGVLESPSGAPTRRLHVEGEGRLLADGSFRLDQSVTFDQEAPKMRTWVMRRLDAHHYTATLTDASGPVKAEAYGDLFHLRYTMKTPLRSEMEQWMYLQPDGRTVVNEATVTVFGIVVGRISERISRQEATVAAP